MTPRWTVALLVAAVCAWPPSLLAADGVLLVQQITGGSSPQTAQVQLEKTRMRADTLGPTGEKVTVIFDADRQTLWMVNYDMKSYMEMTKADVDRTAGQLNAAMSQLEEQLKNMPPAQRAQVEAMMRGRGIGPGAARPARPQYRKTGTDMVGRWSCDKYEGFQNNQKVSELCTVDPKVLNLTAADVEVTRQLATFFEALMPQNANSVFRLGSEEQGFSGLPVRSVSTVAGRQIVSELKEISRQTFTDSTFVVPAGFQKQQMPTAPGRGGRQ
jgi:hypothetical protein